MIWKLECMVLVVIVIYIWWSYHMPYFLLLMLTLAVWFTQPTITAKIRRWWFLVVARWEEFEQHEESMGQLQQQKQQPYQLVDNDENNVPQVETGVNQRPPLSGHDDSSLKPESVLRQRPKPVLRRPPLLSSMPTSYASSPIETKAGVPADKKVNEPHWLKQMTNRAHSAISSVLGQSVRRYDDLRPPGLHNPKNVCFLNVIIQAIAHTPCLPEAVFQLRMQNTRDRLVWHLAELLEQLTVPVSSSIPLVLDTTDFRIQASLEFPGGLVQQPIQMQQRQQDAAECLTWVVEWLHSRMNSLPPPDTAVSSSLGSHHHRHYSTMTVNNLKQKYATQSWQIIVSQRAAAINQIESADGWDSAVYFGSLNTVSEIDWYRHCSTNCSAVNDLFMGQMVDMRLCDACSRVAVSTQVFHILPVPIVEPQLFHGLVSLEACLAQFAQVEQMGGANRLICDHCNRFRTLSGKSSHADPVTPISNHVAPLSPICGGSNLLNDISIGRESQQRTSTPIQSHLRSSVPTVLTDCRRRSLISYLPSCLVIQLMRFAVGHGLQSTKVCLPVVIPLNRLNMSSYVLHNVDPTEAGLSEPSEDYYNLYAVCLHLGSDSTNNGHYVAYARCTDGGWYCFDDDCVRAVNMEYELTTRLVRENAYLLFYERSC